MDTKNKKNILIFILILVQSTFAVEYLNSREAAMGGAAIAVKDNQQAMFNNPAMLYYSKNGLAFPLLNNTIWINDGLTKTVNDINKTNNSDKNEKIKKLSELIPLNLGFGFHTNTSLVMNFPLRSFADKFSVSGYSLFKFNAEVKNPISPEINLRGYSDTIMPALSFAKKLNIGSDFFLEDVITGLTIKKINRVSLYNSDNKKSEINIPLLSLLENEKDGLEYGYQNMTGYGLDLGLSGKIPSTDINVALAVNNLSTRLKGTRYFIIGKETEEATAIQDIATVAKIGACLENDWISRHVPLIGYKIKEKKAKQKVEQILIAPTANLPTMNDNVEVTKQVTTVEQTPAKYAKTIYAFDFDIITEQTSFLKRIHLGLEQPVFPFFNIRLGLNQGYGTCGFNLNIFNKLHCGYTYFTEELGEFVGMKPVSYHIYDFGFYW